MEPSDQDDSESDLRSRINQALGVLMYRHDCDQYSAFVKLCERAGDHDSMGIAAWEVIHSTLSGPAEEPV